MTILILSSPDDLHGQYVDKALRAAGQTAFFFSNDLISDQPSLVFQIPLADDKSTLIVHGGAEIKFADIRAVWNRRPGRVKSPKLPETWMQSMSEWESTRALSGIWRTLSCLWVNHPGKQEEAEHKIYQLEIARQCGLNLPETLVTNDPAAVRALYDTCSGQLIYKLIDEASARYFPAHELPRGLPTMPFREVDIQHLEQVRLSLHLFQQRIEKTLDLRVTVIGSELFPVEIHSQDGSGKLDWRLDYSVPHKLHKLPDDISEACLNILRRLGLNFGAIDLCMDAEGRYYFLEINPAGQYLWLEETLGLPLSSSLAKLLSGQSRPLSQGIP